MSSLPMNPAMVSTTDAIAGYTIVRTLGVAEGIGVNWCGSLMPGRLLEPADSSDIRAAMKEAFLDMLGQAARQGAHAIVGLRYTIPEAANSQIVIAYGTAVVVEPVYR